MRLLLLLCSLICLSFRENPCMVIEENLNNKRLFRTLNVVIALLDQYEKREIDGIDFSDRRTWEHYFLPLKMERRSSNKQRLPNFRKTLLCDKALYEMPTKRSNQLIRKYFHLQPNLQKEVDCHPFTHFVIGIDCHSSPYLRVSFEEIKNTTQKILKDRKEYTLFLSTNNSHFVSFMEKSFPGHIFYTSILDESSPDGVDFNEKSLINAILLSQCAIHIQTGSRISKMANKWNPHQIVEVLDAEWLEREE